MKRIMPLILLVAALAGGYYVWTEVLGGSLSGTGPTNVPNPDVDLPEPDDAVNKGAEGARDGADWLADFLTGLTQETWKIIGLLGIVACIIWVISDAKRRALAFGVAVVILLVLLIG